jgi:hypothetical protein
MRLTVLLVQPCKLNRCVLLDTDAGLCSLNCRFTYLGCGELVCKVHGQHNRHLLYCGSGFDTDEFQVLQRVLNDVEVRPGRAKGRTYHHKVPSL